MRLVDLDKVVEELKLYGIWHEEKDLMPISYIHTQIKGYEEAMENIEDSDLQRIYKEKIHTLQMLILYWRLK